MADQPDHNTIFPERTFIRTILSGSARRAIDPELSDWAAEAGLSHADPARLLANLLSYNALRAQVPVPAPVVLPSGHAADRKHASRHSYLWLKRADDRRMSLLLPEFIWLHDRRDLLIHPWTALELLQRSWTSDRMDRVSWERSARPVIDPVRQLNHLWKKKGFPAYMMENNLRTQLPEGISPGPLREWLSCPDQARLDKALELAGGDALKLVMWLEEVVAEFPSALKRVCADLVPNAPPAVLNALFARVLGPGSAAIWAAVDLKPLFAALPPAHYEQTLAHWLQQEQLGQAADLALQWADAGLFTWPDRLTGPFLKATGYFFGIHEHGPGTVYLEQWILAGALRLPPGLRWDLANPLKKLAGSYSFHQYFDSFMEILALREEMLHTLGRP